MAKYSPLTHWLRTVQRLCVLGTWEVLCACLLSSWVDHISEDVLIGFWKMLEALPEGINLQAAGQPLPFRVLAGVGSLASLCPEDGAAIE